MPPTRPGTTVTMFSASVFIRNYSVFDVFPMGCSTRALDGTRAATEPADADEDRCWSDGGGVKGRSSGPPAVGIARSTNGCLPSRASPRNPDHRRIAFGNWL